MKFTIVKNPNLRHSETVEVAEALYLSDYKIKIHFSDGVKRIVDFKNFLFNKHTHPLYEKYRRKNIFKKFYLLDGNLCWNDYEMIFEVSDLYEGKI